MKLRSSPNTDEELIERCLELEGLNLAQLSTFTGFPIPKEPSKRKGWAGLAVELALGTNAGNESTPDFKNLDIELKTLPLNERFMPAESTFICSIPLLSIHRQGWHSSQCYHKLKRILWVPIEDSKTIPYESRRLGCPFLWSPSIEDEQILANDWLELATMIGTGKLEEIDASLGKYLQVRPKAANGHSLCYGFNSEGVKILTLPRGFYLRASYTAKIL